MTGQKYLVAPGSKPKLGEIDPADQSLFTEGKARGRDFLEKLAEELNVLQRRLYVERKWRVLLIFQGMDTSGKNGTIRNVFHSTDPHAVHVASFGKPTSLELAHDYLWRIHQRCPARGEIVIFDRSHYEDVTAVRVNQLAPEKVWRKRFQHINDFERMLADEETIILKFFLHIDLDEQKKRLQARLDDPEKQWKFDESDLVARAKWQDYMVAYEEVFARTSTPGAPWYIIPANRKWYRNLIVSRIVVEKLRELEPGYPKISYDPGQIIIP
jgi:PPK2 family polyphosphate:nucleotide phosphotransferase